MPDTLIVFTSPWRRRARDVERELQDALIARADGSLDPAQLRTLASYRIPDWARGAKVIHVGPFQHGVEVTAERGH